MTEHAEEFEAHRPVLTGLAYRLLGSLWDAEDVVQDAYLRWSRVDRSEIRDARGFLITVTSRLAIDQLRSARVTREAYVGPWLPEPVATDALGPLDTAELRDTVSYATVHLMERLTPPERAVFVLREAFQLPYEEIASIVEASVANCRQMYSRAGRHLAAGRDRFPLSDDEHAKLLTRFLEAARGGDLAALTELLAEDVVAWSDGGGKVTAARRPVTGRTKVLALITGLLDRYEIEAFDVLDVNGAPALAVTADGQRQVALLGLRDGRIEAVYTMRNPDKLSRLFAGS
ncbi:RNA polymerase sigma-70 factor [Streptomyces sp. NBC_00083]|uniref:RNA polymerase sigma-70 factor n=1 Tax=Streptomyces sp. NBC_00083 TaxID=2975647 RepID=UPI00225BB1EF|nr:RNA polymerase sigma-70 factor [Streptomyces sp. NBC_00083]MCX5383992.1 RNA polymerase sigma-70 factor [Streptomyces sp. NBC_00083]